MEAQIYNIDSNTYEIKFEESEYPIDSINSLIEELPDNSPRFIILSYPFESKDGRKVNPLIFIYWRPSTSKQDNKMLFAGCLDLFKDQVSASKFIEIVDEEEFEDLVDQIMQ
ncbi:hypothetical protein CANARDRAFT_28188 [[Candida] arabinofermentans NRRL YB-2248]|uniref:ADF-H domain-containing protein n=1 Tax=[Candida] arabinofermentans NRRL YB-2248 TaxID=983967 RepID=A0A1E4T0W5_9ASCO|nr:hypothetical protein CANARDRAFT_28188 [[Candida] arabinofermentans NRRL YB-2248]